MDAKQLNDCCTRDAIATDDAIHPDVVVKIVARRSAGNFVDVLENRKSVNFKHLGTSNARPVKTLRSKNSGKIGASAVDKLD
jgi:hypothetical protein